MKIKQIKLFTVGVGLAVATLFPLNSALAVTADDVICNKCVDTTDIASQAVTTVKLKDAAVTQIKIADGAVSTKKIQDGAIVKSKIADNAVSKHKIRDGAITKPKISDGAVSKSKLALNARSFTVTSSAATILTPTDSACINHASGNITVTVPGPGTVLVTNRTWIYEAHTNGSNEWHTVVVSDTVDAGCTDWAFMNILSIPSQLPTYTAFNPNTMVVHKSFEVPSAGTYTFYVNVRAGSTGTRFWYSGSTATYIP